MSEKILIIEDEDRMRRLLALVLSEEGYTVKTARNGKEGVAIWSRWQPAVVLSDLKMPDMDGLEVLRFRNRNFAEVPLIILTAFGTVDTAVAAMKDGAYDFLTKPVDNNKVIEIVNQAVSSVRSAGGQEEMIGSSPVMQRVYRDIAMVAETSSSVLITGESGTGKELVALAIHKASGRPDTPFVRVNCPAIPQNLLESELFGHKRGSFTGAVEDREGAFVRADGGTLFLDEIGDLPLELQPKILHAVEEKSVTPVGGANPRTVQVKIISATNRNLDKMIFLDQFRNDLYYRLNTFHISLPPLRERGSDLDELIEHFTEEFCAALNKPRLRLAPEALEAMHQYRWPGNIRELKSVLERMCLACRGEVIGEDLLPEKIRCATEHAPEQPGRTALFDLAAQERQLILRALEKCGWNQSQAARHLGITRNTLRYRMKKYMINRDQKP